MTKKTTKKNILITGSSGTIGTRLFEKLLEAGYGVTGFDRKENSWHQSLNRLTVMGDLLDRNDLQKISGDFDLIVHLAANARVYDLVVSPDLALENIVSTYNTLSFARERGVKNIIFASSREVYANKAEAVSREEDVDITLCESPYAASKIADEALVYSFAKCYGLEAIICRFSNVYGMYDGSNRFVPLMIRYMERHEDVTVFGDDKILDFTYIDDCVNGIIRCLERFEKVKGNVFNIASGRGTKLVDVARLLKKLTGSRSQILVGGNRTGEVVKFIADISKAETMLGYRPQHFIEDGISLAVAWYREHR